MSPSEPSTAMKNQMSTRLPERKTIVDIFADFMGYLFDLTKELFKASEPNGELRWNSVSNSVELVLTHPNGWGNPQQTKLRTAAIKAGIAPDNPAGHSRIHFVTEGEAIFHFCATHTQAGGDLGVCHTFSTRCWFLTNSQRGERALIINAGGGAIDISAYRVLGNRPLQVEELYEPKCELDQLRSQTFLLNCFPFRLTSRWRARYSKGKSLGPRCTLIFHPETEYSAWNQRS